jgi:hypothetical protein
MNVRVEWFEHDCEYISKYCHEHHTRSAALPLELLQDPAGFIQAAEARGVMYAQEELVRRDQFTARTLTVLDELEPRVAVGDFVSDLYPVPTSHSSGPGDAHE